jgi:GT2 family glycosyltransferase
VPELVLPRVAQPELSVVIVAFGRLRWTRRTLLALAEHTDPCYEVVVVDNGSEPTARSYLRNEMENATVVFNDENRGFGAACNQGAALARGRHLLFLNNDALVHVGWLRPLLGRLRDPRVGAVGPKLLNPGGSLQSAGALVSRTGSTLEHGFGADPAADEFTFPRVVDFVSGSCLALRRGDFTGFDPAYGRGYYEDADLCLALAERGALTVYEPASTVTHVRGVSGFTTADPDLPIRNRAVFERRWRHVLRDRPHPPLASSRRRILAARDAPAASRTLRIGRELPEPRPMDLAERLTILVQSASPDHLQGWLRAGAEVALDGSPDWFAERRFLYEQVVVDPDAWTPWLGEALARTQPQAEVRAAAGSPGAYGRSA